MKFKVLPWGFAVSLSLISLAGYAALPTTTSNNLSSVNSINNGQIIQSGTYENTAGNLTTFKNTSGTGLFLNSGSSLKFTAPGNVVLLDGSINLEGISKNGSTPHIGSDDPIGNTQIFLQSSQSPVNSVTSLTVNSVNNGPIIQSGTYANTSGNSTTFENTAGTGLWLKSGSNIRGIETDALGNPTNNGGNFLLLAPGQVVRLDGNIDVRGLLDKQGDYLGSGGKVMVSAGYLYQNGNIYADGSNGGLVQFNVGSMTLSGTARIEANGDGTNASYVSGGLPGYQGGSISINSTGPVDIQKNTTLNINGAKGEVNIEGSVVNVAGIIQASGAEFAGGTIRLVSTGQSDITQTLAAIQTATNQGIFTSSESTNITNSLTNLVSNHDGDIIVAAPDSGNLRGGFLSTKTAIFAAERNINNGGWILTDGNPSLFQEGSGNSDRGGVISLNAGSTITNAGRISANGLGVDGVAGMIALSYKDGLSNSGSIVATSTSPNGGGLIEFSGPVNPSSNGLVAALSFVPSTIGGTIVLPDPFAVQSNRLIGVRDQTHPNEILFDPFYFGGIMFLNTTIPGQSSITNVDFNTLLTHAKIRSGYDQLGLDDEISEIEYTYYGGRSQPQSNAVIVSSNDGSALTMNFPNVFSATPTSLTILSNGSVTIPNSLSDPGMPLTIPVGYNYFTHEEGNDEADSIRGRLSIISNSLNFQDGESFTISDKTDYLYDRVQPEFGPTVTQVTSSTNMGAGSVDIAVKSLFSGSQSSFNILGQNPSWIFKSPNP